MIFNYIFVLSYFTIVCLIFIYHPLNFSFTNLPSNFIIFPKSLNFSIFSPKFPIILLLTLGIEFRIVLSSHWYAFKLIQETLKIIFKICHKFSILFQYYHYFSYFFCTIYFLIIEVENWQKWYCYMSSSTSFIIYNTPTFQFISFSCNSCLLSPIKILNRFLIFSHVFPHFLKSSLNSGIYSEESLICGKRSIGLGHVSLYSFSEKIWHFFCLPKINS